MEGKGTNSDPPQANQSGAKQMGSPASSQDGRLWMNQIGAQDPSKTEQFGTKQMGVPDPSQAEQLRTNQIGAQDPSQTEQVRTKQIGSPGAKQMGFPNQSQEEQLRTNQIGSPAPLPAEKWGTKQMGAPAPPPTHPKNQQAAASWGPHRNDEDRPPYILFDSSPNQRQGTGGSPMNSILEAFNTWTRNAETLASNVWQNLRTGPSITDTAWGKVSLTAKAFSEGGYETLYRQSFSADPSDRVIRSFACYLSTSTGPVAGTLYITTLNLAFCSDRPLYFRAPSGQDAWSYYKVLVPIRKIANVNPMTVRENPPERYIHIVTSDGHEFWFMGFVSYDKASTRLMNAVHDAAAAGRQAEISAPGSV